MIIYPAGGVTGNLNPAYKKMKEPTPHDFAKGLQDANFWQGGRLGTGYKTRLRQ